MPSSGTMVGGLIRPLDGALPPTIELPRGARASVGGSHPMKRVPRRARCNHRAASPYDPWHAACSIGGSEWRSVGRWKSARCVAPGPILKALLVDDHAVVREGLRRILTEVFGGI